MKIWLVSMECAGISEAGGVKDVVYSLCKGFSSEKEDVTLFIPVFGCTSLKSIRDFKADFISNVAIDMCCKNEIVTFSSGRITDTSCKVVFVNHPSFSNKKGVYVYTEEEQRLDGSHVKGRGHEDMLFLDTLFSKAVCEYGKYISETDCPDIIHCHDASTAVLPCYVRKLQKAGYFRSSKCVVTIHNAGPAYHHEFPDVEQARYYTGLNQEELDLCHNGNRIEPFLLGAENASLTTVSTFYAEELLNPSNAELTDGLSVCFHERNLQIEGITNGVNYDYYSPDIPELSLLPFPMNPRKGDVEGKMLNRKYFLNFCVDDQLVSDSYTKGFQKFGWISVPEKNPVYFMYHGRIVWQKGIQILLDSISGIIEKYPSARFILCGQGDPQIEKNIQEIAERFSGKVVFFNGYNEKMARLVAAASDFVILPSFFEPCGLEDFIAQIYGTIPIAHATGGLKKIIDGETGYLFKESNAEDLVGAVSRAVDFMFAEKDNLKGMVEWTADFIHSVYSWDFVIQTKYLKFFQKCKKNT